MIRDGHDEEGSTLITAVAVMLILSTLSLAGLARTLTVMRFARSGQDYDAALAVADSGLDDAVYVIDNGAPAADWSRTNIANGNGTYSYKAQYVDGADYRVYSKGVVGKSAHGVQALVSRAAKFPFTLFSKNDLSIDGSTSGSYINFYSYNSFGPLASTPPNVGSDGRVICNGNQTGFITHFVYGQSDCPNPYQEPKPYALDDVVAPSTTRSPSCPATGTWGPSTFNLSTVMSGGVISPLNIPLVPVTTIDGQNGVPFVCNQDVAFYGLIQVVNPPVKIYVMDHNVDLSNAIVNVASLALNTPATASGFQLYQSSGNVDFGSGNTVNTLSFCGVYYAPKTTVSINGGKWWTGAVIANQVKVNGTPNFKIGYDVSLASYWSDKWGVSHYREVPSSSLPL